MAVYWIDPYTASKNINSLSANGVHGTINSTTRNGTYDYPFTFADMVSCTSSVTPLTSLNGVPFNLGDEIRLKGLPLTDFFYNTGTSGNSTTSGTSSNTITVYSDYQVTQLRVSNTAHQTALTNYKTYLNNMGYSCPTALVYDNKLQGWNPYFFQTFGYNFADTSGYIVQHSYLPPTYPYWYATSRQDSALYQPRDIAFIDSKYYITGYETDSTQRYIFAFGSATSNTANNGGITISDGWTSNTTRSGVTILPIARSSGSGQYNLFNATSSYIKNIDLPNTHIIICPTGASADTTGGVFNIFPYGCANNVTSRFGSYYINSGYNSWNYIYNNNTVQANSNFAMGTACYGYYLMWGSGTSPVANCTTTLYNLISGGASPYSQLNSTTNIFEVGHFFSQYQYSDNCLFYSPSTYGGTFKFAANSFIYCPNGPYALTNSNFSNYTIIIGSNVTNYADYGNSPYPYAYTYSNLASPQLRSTLISGSKPFDADLKLSPAKWYDINSLQEYGGQAYTYSGPTEKNITLGILNTEGVNYKTSDSKLYTTLTNYHSAYTDFAVTNYNFISNTYDNKIISLIPLVSTGISTPYPAMICYNEPSANNDLCFQSNPLASGTNGYYKKALMLTLPSLTGKTTLNVSCKVLTTSNFSSNSYIQLALHYRTNTNTANFQQLTGGFNLAGTESNWSVVKSLSTMDTTVGYVGLSIAIRPVGGYANKYYFGNVSVVVT